MKMETQLSKVMGCGKSSSKREVYGETGLPQKTRKLSNKQPKVIPKETRKRAKKAQS